MSGRRWMTVAALIAVMVPATALRTWRLDAVPGLNGDEAVHGYWARLIVERGERPLHAPDSRHVNRLDGTVHLDRAVPHYAPWLLYGLAATFRLFGAGIVSLRGFGVVMNLGALVIWFFALRRALGISAAFIATLALAVMPLHVATSRTAFQTVLVPPLVTLSLAALLRWRATADPRSLAGLALAAGLAIGQHALALVNAALVIGLLVASRPRRARDRSPWTASVVICSVALFCLAATPQLPMLVEAATNLLWGEVGAPLSLTAVAGRNLDPGAAVVSELLAVEGGMVYAHLAGIGLVPTTWLRLSGGVLLLVLTIGGVVHVARRGSGAARLLTLYAGVNALAPLAIGVAWAPGNERYLVGLLPTVVVPAAIASAKLIARARRAGRAPLVALLGLLLLPLLGWVDGLVACAAEWNRRGGGGNAAHWTAVVEPKRAAFEALAPGLEALHPSDPSHVVVAGDWWVYWPLRFMAPLEAPIVSTHAWESVLGEPGLRCVAIVAFPYGADEERALAAGQRLRALGWSFSERVVPRPDGRPALRIRLYESPTALLRGAPVARCWPSR